VGVEALGGGDAIEERDGGAETRGRARIDFTVGVHGPGQGNVRTRPDLEVHVVEYAELEERDEVDGEVLAGIRSNRAEGRMVTGGLGDDRHVRGVDLQAGVRIVR